MSMLRLASCTLACAVAASAVSADVVTQWNFQGIPVGVNNSPAPSIGAGVATVLGMDNNLNGVTSVAAADIFGNAPANGSTDPVQGGTTGRVWRIRGGAAPGGPSANGWSSFAPQFSQGAQFAVSTSGFGAISVSYDIYVTDRGPAHWQLQYTTDGSAWNSAGPLGFANLAGDRWYNGNTVDLSGVAATANNPLFAIRIVTAYAPGTSSYLAADGGPMSNTSGNWRFDMVTVSGTVPTPGAMGLLGLAGLVAARRRR
jgi:MYXO-CTERM domain-containing protein